MRQMTFEIPEDVAERFSQDVPASEQSHVVTQLLSKRTSRRIRTEQEWHSAAEAANNDPETQQIQREMAALPGTMTEPRNGDLASSQRRERDLMFERACDALEGDPDLALLDFEMDALNDDPIAEPSHVSEAR